MKNLYFVLLCLSFACKQEAKVPNAVKSLSDSTTLLAKKKDTIPTKRTGNPKFYTQEDTVKIAINEDDTFSYSKQRFNHIVDLFPELYNSNVYDPDFLYSNNQDFRHFINEDGDEERIGFSSELGHDSYCVLYSYFLQKRTGEEKFEKRRKNLIAIYRKTNGIFEGLRGGGTYFGHQHRRILGYAEYSIYRYSNREDDFKRKYDIYKQKELYINSLKQIIKDEISVNYVRQEREEKEKEFYEVIDELAVLITDYFYLKEARAFQYAYYNY